jgi:hypothetical protein
VEDKAPGIHAASDGSTLYEIDIGYDAVGNRRRVASSVKNRHSGVASVSTSTQWLTYDAMNRWRGEGSLVSGAIQESKYTEFDAAGRALRSVTRNGTTTITTAFEYDLANRIVSERGSLATTQYGRLAPYTYANRLNRSISYSDGLHLEAWAVYAEDAVTQVGTRYASTFFQANGSTSRVLNEQEGLARTYTFDSWYYAPDDDLWYEYQVQRSTTAVDRQKSGEQLYSYDKAGNLAKLVVDGYAVLGADANPANPDQVKRMRWASQSVYRYSYYLLDGYRERGQALSGSQWSEANSLGSGDNAFVPTESRLSYDANGQLAQLSQQLGDGSFSSTWYVTDTAGKIVQRRATTQDAIWGTSATGYYYGPTFTNHTNQDFLFKRWHPADNANPTVANPPATVYNIVPTGASLLPQLPAFRDAGNWSKQSNLIAQDQLLGSFSQSHTSSYQYAWGYLDIGARQGFASQDQSVQFHTAQAGETASTLAGRYYGDTALWYVIAEANNLRAEPQATATAGTALKIPKVVRNTNTSTSYGVYEPSKIIGNTSPEVALPPPPPAPKGGCGVVGQLIMVVVAVWVTYVTAGAAGTAIGSSLGAFSGAAAGAVGATVGSIASQTVGVAIGAQQKFSWKQVGLAALGGAVGGAINGIPQAGIEGAFGSNGVAGLLDISAKASPYLSAAVNSVATNVMTQGIGVATKMQEKFNWRSVAASALAAPVAKYIGDTMFGAPAQGASLGFGERVSRNLVNGVVSQRVRMAITRSGKMDYASIAADAFGNALGQGVVDAMSAPSAADNRTALNKANVKADADYYGSGTASSSTPSRDWFAGASLRLGEGGGGPRLGGYVPEAAAAASGYDDSASRVRGANAGALDAQLQGDVTAIRSAYERQQRLADAGALASYAGAEARRFSNYPGSAGPGEGSVREAQAMGFFNEAEGVDPYSGPPSQWPRNEVDTRAMQMGRRIGEIAVAVKDDPLRAAYGVVKGVVNTPPELFNFAVNTTKLSLNGYSYLLGDAGASFRASQSWQAPTWSLNGDAELGGSVLGALASPWAVQGAAKITSLTYVAAQDRGVRIWLTANFDDAAKVESVYSSAVDGTRRLGYSFNGMFGYRAANNETSAFRRGEFMSLERPTSPADAIERSALNPNWGNQATELYQVKAGPGFYFKGQVAPQAGVYEVGPLMGSSFYLGGGYTQIFKPTIKLPSGAPSAPWTNSVKLGYGG